MKKFGGKKTLAKPSSQQSLKYSWHTMTREAVPQNKPHRLVIVGIGNVGIKAVTKFMNEGACGLECIAISNNRSHLDAAKAHQKILIKEKTISRPFSALRSDISKTAIDESRYKIEQALSSADIVFVTASFDSKTPIESAPAVAEIAKKNGAVTVGIVTTPPKAEKDQNKHVANAICSMRNQCDTVIIIDNNKVTQLAPKLTTTDEVLANVIKEIVETMSAPNLINLDVADFRNLVSSGGFAVIGVGESDAPNRAEEAVRNALKSSMLDIGYSGATGALIHVTGDSHMTIEEANRVGEIVTEMMDNNARVLWGARVNPTQEGRLKVTLVMTGVNSQKTRSSLGAIAPQLFDMDPYADPEKNLNIKLDLYQIESF
ncbi:cell division protein FtsZ [Candidatus Bathyarchaeota archaeon]|nr:cell division protein FtsZ [Candidatus Bathyarchaeota archaeon]